MLKQNPVAHEVLGLAEINAGGVQSNRVDPTLNQETGRAGMDSGKVKLGYRIRSPLIGSHVPDGVEIELRGAGVEEDNRTGRDSTVPGLPPGNVVDGYLIVAIVP